MNSYPIDWERLYLKKSETAQRYSKPRTTRSICLHILHSAHLRKYLTLHPYIYTTQAAVRLFALMRQMDENEAIDVIVAESVPESGLGRAIMDRLRRASAVRE